MDGLLKIPSDMSNLYRVECLLEELMERFNVSVELMGNISVSVIEAVSNAIQHGNRNDVTKIVQLKYSKQNECITFSIIDEGSGFNIELVPDPTLPENIENIKGRGLFLIRHLADKVSFACNGSEIQIHFKLT
jgi:serine/threonine-protein kinase RsbW